MTKSVNKSVNNFQILSSSLSCGQNSDNQMFRVILLHVLSQDGACIK
jgi:hypothetical protein